MIRFLTPTLNLSHISFLGQKEEFPIANPIGNVIHQYQYTRPCDLIHK